MKKNKAKKKKKDTEGDDSSNMILDSRIASINEEIVKDDRVTEIDTEINNAYLRSTTQYKHSSIMNSKGMSIVGSKVIGTHDIEISQSQTLMNSEHIGNKNRES